MNIVNIAVIPGLNPWNGFREFWNYVLFSYPAGEEDVRVTVGLVIMILSTFVLTGIFLRFVKRFVSNKLQNDDKVKFFSIFRFVEYLVYVVVILITLSSAGVDITILLTASAAFFVGFRTGATGIVPGYYWRGDYYYR